MNQSLLPLARRRRRSAGERLLEALWLRRVRDNRVRPGYRGLWKSEIEKMGLGNFAHAKREARRILQGEGYNLEMLCRETRDFGVVDCLYAIVQDYSHERWWGDEEN